MRTKLGLIREYRAKMRRQLLENPIVNATTVGYLRSAWLKPSRENGRVYNCFNAKDELKLYAQGNWCRAVSLSRMPNGQGGARIICWMEKYIAQDGGQGMGLFGEARCVSYADIVFHYGGSFWVIDNINVREQSEGRDYIVYLKPAEYAKKAST